MTEWLVQMATFLLQTTVVVALLVVGLLLLRRRGTEDSDDGLTLHVTSLNDQRRARNRRLRLKATTAGARKKLEKTLRQQEKTRQKSAKETSSNAPEPRAWVLDFHGDLKASQTEQFAQEVSSLIEVAACGDEVVVRLESAGGLVHAYGLAAAQLDRLRDAGLVTTVCIDKVAASGGYMMACTASHIKAAPFAVIGSIGVVAQVPNIHRLLKRHDVDVELLTAGKYKRTLTMLGENTQEGREKFIDDLENTHRLFKDYVAKRRPEMDINALATGEIWYGSEALNQHLVDSVETSEAYLVQRMQEIAVYHLKLEPPRTLSRKIGLAVSAGVENGLMKVAGLIDAAGWQRH